MVALLRVQGSPFTRDSIDNRGLSVDRAEPGTKRATGHLGDQALLVLQEFVARNSSRSGIQLEVSFRLNFEKFEIFLRCEGRKSLKRM